MKHISSIYNVIVCVYEGVILAANMERSGLFLKLFKLVFGSVSLLPAENELMRKVTLLLNYYYGFKLVR